MTSGPVPAGSRLRLLPIDQLMRVADRILFAWGSLPVEVVGLLALLPIVDPVSDLAVFNQLLSRSYYMCSMLLLLLLAMHWRFCTLYAAFTPPLTKVGIATLLLPFCMLPFWGRILGEEVREADLLAAYDEMGAIMSRQLARAPTASGPSHPPPPLQMPRLPLASLPAPLRSSSPPSSPQMQPPLFAPAGAPAAKPPGPMMPPPPESPARGAVGSSATFVLPTPMRGRARKCVLPGKAGSRLPRYGTEAGLVRAYVERHHADYERHRCSLTRQALFLIAFEAKLTGLSLVVGPFLLWRAALTLARNAALSAVGGEREGYNVLEWVTPRGAGGAKASASSPRWQVPSTAETEADERLLHCRVLTFLEAAFESLPQAALQSGVLLLYPGSLQPNLYLFSVVCSLGVTAVALITFAQHRHRVRLLVEPPRSALSEHAAALSEAGDVGDAASLLADVAAARAAGVPSSEVRAAVLRLHGVRVQHAHALKSHGCGAAVLLAAGYTPAELCAAGYSAADLGCSGLPLAELKKLGYSLRELREDAQHTTQALHAAGHSLAELVEAGATASELQELKTFSTGEMRLAGASAADLRATGCTAEELHSAGFAASALKQAGWSVPELKCAGCSASGLREAGCTVFELRAAGYPLSEIQAADEPAMAPPSDSRGPLLLEGPGSKAGSANKQIADGTECMQKLGRDREQDANYAYTKLPPNFPDGSSEPWLTNRTVVPPEHRPMPRNSPAPIFDRSGRQMNQRRWCNRTMGYIGTDAFAL